MALTRNLMRTGRAGASDLADLREYIQAEQEAERQRVEKRTGELAQFIASCLTDEQYHAWLTSTPDDNAGFLQACEAKAAELEAIPHPVDEAQRIERAIDSELIAESKQVVLSAVPVKATVSRSWAERHLNTDVNGFEAELDKAFGVGKWILKRGCDERNA